ncbi:snRNA-activating protein complex subunit isoform X2 [Phalaenopsis equestris]|nr:snRNA-activating protein complex subunit isoform X2 [Phalaenopsis equestris]XP_020586952.1 snRNA-activating protein complex subunit isoform X2 [Phalaenopsis equestris]
MNLNKEIISSSISENGSSNLESPTLLNDSSELIRDTDVSEKVQQKGSKKRGRRFDRNTRAAELESCYVGRVTQLAKIKQRQDEDKLAARLHSFSGNSKSMEGAMVTLDKIEKMQSLKLMTSSLKVKASTSKVHKPVYYPEAILCVEIYHQSTLKKVQEFLVLESQNLSELRDNIYCLTDKLMLAAEKYDSSGYFLIEETFYNDLRSPAATDYSKPIFDWLENQSDEALKKWEFIMSGEPKKKQMELLGNLDFSNFPNFKASEMHKTTFCDLRFRLGAGYLYCHQGNCKHTIVFRDLRLIHPDDSHNRADYPLLTFQIKPRKRKCSVCQIYQATKMTVEDKWAPDDPSYFCIKCYFLLHYKEDNTLLYPHTVYDYFHE